LAEQGQTTDQTPDAADATRLTLMRVSPAPGINAANTGQNAVRPVQSEFSLDPGGRMRFGNVEIRPVGGGVGCLTMLLVSVIASVVLTILLNLIV
jgi:hypothetical protein